MVWVRRPRQARRWWIVERLGSADRPLVVNQKIGTRSTTSGSMPSVVIVKSGAGSPR